MYFGVSLHFFNNKTSTVIVFSVWRRLNIDYNMVEYVMRLRSVTTRALEVHGTYTRPRRRATIYGFAASRILTFTFKIACLELNSCVATGWVQLLDWTNGLDYWTGPGLLDWTTGLDYWTGLLDSPKLQNTCRSVQGRS